MSEVVKWRTFEDLHTGVSILFDQVKYLTGCGIEHADLLTDDPMPYDIINSLVEKCEVELKKSWDLACSDRRTDSKSMFQLVGMGELPLPEHGQPIDLNLGGAK
jgi:hypothetical protein